MNSSVFFLTGSTGHPHLLNLLMSHFNADTSAPPATLSQNFDIISAVEDLNGLASRELNKLLKESDNFIIQWNTGKGSSRQIDMERLASSLPLHLIAVLLSPDTDMHMVHLLRGVRLLYTLSDLASRHPRLEQILLDDVKVSEQIMDLVFFMLIILARYEQGNLHGTSLPFLHSALVACTLHLLPGYISSQWHDLVVVLLAHPKVDMFMDIAYDAVHVDIRTLQNKLLALNTDVLCNKYSLPAAERTSHYLCQQCEASLQFLVSLCQQKLFRDRLLKNKKICTNGGILSLVHTAIKLNVPICFKESSDIMAAVSRIKAKVLSILLQFCEAENISYLDEVASSDGSMDLAKSVTLAILDLLKTVFASEAKRHCGSLERASPKGLVLLNSMRLADIFSDDSNFRYFFMTNTIEVLVEILASPHEAFLSSWCSVDIPMIEEDANVEYDPFTAAGVALLSFISGCESALGPPVLLNDTSSTSLANFSGNPSTTYAQQRTSYLVKIIANLHCFNPNFCKEEERNIFVNKFHECLIKETPESLSRYNSKLHPLRDATIYRNLSSLSNYAASLVLLNLLNGDDVELLRQFSYQLQKLLSRQTGDNLIQEPLIKDEVTTEHKIEGHCPVQQSLHNWAKFPSSKFDKLNQDIINTGEAAPSLGKDAQQDFKDKDPDIKGEFSESRLGQDLDQFIVKSKQADLPDDLELTQDRRKNIHPITRSELGSFRGIEKGIPSSETKGLEQNSNGDVDPIPDNGETYKLLHCTKESGFQEDNKAEAVHGEEKQPRKRKRNIMNEKQILLIEKALLDEPEMQRNAPLLQSWADTLSGQGSEITASQLKNWLNNRKARLARAARDTRAPSEGDNTFPDKSCIPNVSHYYDSPDSGGEECYTPSARGSAQQCIPKSGGMGPRASSSDDVEIIPASEFAEFTAQRRMQANIPSAKPVLFEPGQSVSVVDADGQEFGKGKVFQVEGRWHGRSLEDRSMFVVDLVELKVEKWRVVQHPSEASGTTFEEAADRNGGVIRVLWDANKIVSLPL